MGNFRFEHVIDFAAKEVDVAIRCEACRHKRELTAGQLAAIFGIQERLTTVRRRLKCTKCGHKGAQLAPIPRLES